MKGAIIGNLIGVPYEFSGNRDKDFTYVFPMKGSKFMDDDTLLTLATAQSLLTDSAYNITYSYFASQYPNLPYGNRFRDWMYSTSMEPYNSMGNGSAMRVSPVGFIAKSHEWCMKEAEKSSACTHNHPEGIRAAKFVADVIYQMRNNGVTRESGFDTLCNSYGYPHHVDVEDMRGWYEYSELAESTIHAAIACFKYATDFEDAIRNACSIGGDADTIAAIVGAWAELQWGIPPHLEDLLDTYLPTFAKQILDQLYQQ